MTTLLVSRDRNVTNGILFHLRVVRHSVGGDTARTLRTTQWTQGVSKFEPSGFIDIHRSGACRLVLVIGEFVKFYCDRIQLM